MRDNGILLRPVLWTPAEWKSRNRLIAWYRESGIVSSGGNLSFWTDSSGNGRTTNAISASPPTVVVNGGENSVVCVRASSQWVTWQGTAIPRAGHTAGLMWALFKTAASITATDTMRLLSLGTTAAAISNAGLGFGNVTAFYPISSVSVAGTVSRSEYQTAASASTVYSFVFENDTTGNTCRMWWNESTVADVLTAGTEGTWLSDFVTDMDRIGIGCNPAAATPTLFFGGTIFECGWYHGLAPGHEIVSLLRYLRYRRSRKT